MGCAQMKPEFREAEHIHARQAPSLKRYESLRSLGNFSDYQEVDNEIDEGRLLCNFVDELDKNLPRYLLFKPEVITYYKKGRRGTRVGTG